MDADVYTEIKTLIKRNLKIDLENYKAGQMQRRLDSWLVRSRSSTWKDYFHVLSVDASELERFRNYLTINVTEFFRDQNRWDIVRDEILPHLIRNAKENYQGDGLKLWSAGCSIGAEAYTLAMLMAEVFPRQKYLLLATDLDRGALSIARSHGPYTQEDLHSLNEIQRQKYISAAAPYYVNESLQKYLRFEEQDLLAGRFDTGFDLIVCRNVVIYFTAEAKDTLYARFSAALRPGGVLFLGGTEIISGAGKFGLQNFGVSFYRKIG
jgi:chemotaxis protein methyltransferase CheR